MVTWQPDPEFPDVLVNTDSVTGPPDLAHAIQVAIGALHQSGIHQGVSSCNCTLVAQTVVKAAAPVLLQATRDRLADLEVYATDLYAAAYLFLQHATEGLEPIGTWDGWYDSAKRLRGALQTDPPARGRAILDEVERLRALAAAVRACDDPDDPPPFSVREALTAIDLAAAQEENSG